MKIVDLSHVMNVHTPGWVGYAGNKMYYAQNMQTQTIVAQRIETALHVGTHFDGAMHATDGRNGDMASLPLDYLVNHGVVVDLSDKVTDWSVITPEMIEIHRRRHPRRRHPHSLHRLGEILRRAVAAGSRALLLLPPGPEPRHHALDAEEEDQVVRHGHRLLRPRDEHVDPQHAARHRGAVHANSTARRRRNSSARSTTRTSARAVTSPPTCSRCTPGRSRKDLLHAENLGGDHRAGRRQALPDRRLPVALRGAGVLPLPHPRVPRQRH